MSQERIERALENHREKGYNCAQAVFCAFCDEFDIDEVTAYRMMEAFGGGMGGMRDTCGAVSSMAMAVSLRESDGKPGEGRSKAQTYSKVKELVEKFKERNETILCRELLVAGSNQGRGICRKCIADAAEILEEYLEGANDN